MKKAKAEKLEEEIKERVQQLENPTSEEDFRANLFWIAERGKEDDLKLLQGHKKNPPYTSDEILQLLDIAIQRISERMSQNKQLIEEEMRDLASYLSGIPPSLRSSGAFAAYEARLELLQQQLARRDDSPAAAQRQGEEAYRLHKEEWDKRYAGRYIAIYQGEVIASDTKQIKLMEKIVKRQREQGPFRACIMKIESPVRGKKRS